MNRSCGHVDLLGISYPVSLNGGGALLARVEPGCRVEEFSWCKLPNEGTLMWKGTPVMMFFVFPDNSSFLASDYAEARKKGFELAALRTNPNGAALQDLQDRWLFYLNRYDEDIRRDGQGEIRLIEFTFDTRRGNWGSRRWDKDINTWIVYIPSNPDEFSLGRGHRMVCKWERTLQHDRPTRDREGFMLVLVRVQYEHIHPHVRKNELEREIEYGMP